MSFFPTGHFQDLFSAIPSLYWWFPNFGQQRIAMMLVVLVGVYGKVVTKECSFPHTGREIPVSYSASAIITSESSGSCQKFSSAQESPIIMGTFSLVFR